VRLRVVDTIADHPLPEMLDRGLCVTINSDDPAYFGGYVDDNFAAVQDAFDLSADQLATLARNAVWASFLPVDRRAPLIAEIEEWRASQ
jgi:adenosine deaminase